MEKIGIIGAGASGLVAAIFAKSNNNEVIIFERNNVCGKKILATGNGRCNYFNSDNNLIHYESSNPDLISNVINEKTENLVLNFFDRLGIIPQIKNGYYYPFSNQASTIRNVLLEEAKRKGITIYNDFLVTDIKKDNNKFLVIGDWDQIYVDRLVIATGSYASPKTGSDGMGYNFLKNMGHSIIKVLPSLVQLKTKGNFLKTWSGVRTQAVVSLYEDNNFVRSEEGEIQLTDYGVSGICVFNLSNKASRLLDNNKKVDIRINFLPFINEDYNNWFINQTNLTSKNINALLLSILNEKIVEVILKESKINTNKKYNELNNDEQNKLISFCTNFKLEITGTKSFNESQVCSGGIPLTEVNLSTMESKIVSNLYITGELLDITGDCGGYNLGIAWRTGIIAGCSIKGDNND